MINKIVAFYKYYCFTLLRGDGMENKREIFHILTRRFGLLNKNCCLLDRLKFLQFKVIYL